MFAARERTCALPGAHFSEVYTDMQGGTFAGYIDFTCDAAAITGMDSVGSLGEVDLGRERRYHGVVHRPRGRPPRTSKRRRR